MLSVAKNERADENSPGFLPQNHKPHRRGVGCSLDRMPGARGCVVPRGDQFGLEELPVRSNMTTAGVDEEAPHGC